MVSLADVGVLTGFKRLLRRRSADVADAVEQEDVRHRRRRHDRQRRLRRAVLAAEHLGVLGDVRRADVHHAEPSAVPGDRRQQVHRRDGARHVQQRASTACRRRAIGSSTSTGSPAPATDATRAGSARRSNAVRRTSCGFSRRCPASSTRRTATGAIYVNLYVSSETTFTVGGQRLALSVESEMPWGGTIDGSTCRRGDAGAGRDQAAHSGLGAQPVPCPAACTRTSTRLEQPTTVVASTARRVERDARRARATSRSTAQWKNGDVIEVEFPDRAVARSSADARVKRDARARRRSSAGRSSTAPSGRTSTTGSALGPAARSAAASRTAEPIATLLGGVTVIRTQAARMTRPARRRRRRSRSFRITSGPIAAPAK